MLHLNKCSQPLKTCSSFATNFTIVLLSTQKLLVQNRLPIAAPDRHKTHEHSNFYCICLFTPVMKWGTLLIAQNILLRSQVPLITCQLSWEAESSLLLASSSLINTTDCCFINHVASSLITSTCCFIKHFIPCKIQKNTAANWAIKSTLAALFVQRQT